MPSDMTSILERMQDPRYEDSLPRPAPTTTNEADYSMYYGPYMPGGGPPPPPPPPGSTELYSMMPQNGDPRYTSARNQHHPPMPPMPAAMYYDPRYMAMADHYHRQMQPMQPMPPMQPMQPMPPMQPVPPMQPAPPVPPILGAGHQQREEVRQPQPPRPVATASSSASAEPRFGSPEEEQAWKRANRMTTSSPPAYSLL
ncbi:hypothetical protein GGF42_003426 [Coemansia sp. RSA 2424]|nr:hypothetical protein GGF42_003426 [Coemansia sp. RSA 2424]